MPRGGGGGRDKSLTPIVVLNRVLTSICPTKLPTPRKYAIVHFENIFQNKLCILYDYLYKP